MTDQRLLRAAAALAAALVCVFAWRSFGDGQQAPPVAIAGAGGPAIDAAPGRAGREPPGLWVHVAGSVRRPGLYRVPPGSRAAAAVDAAGGPARRADLAAVNLAAPLSDGQQVLVPARGRAGGRAAASPGQPGGSAPAGASSGAKLSLSSATQEELERLDGIGPALARRILDYRDAHGGFRSVRELEQVEGIGEKRLAALSAAVQP